MFYYGIGMETFVAKYIFLPLFTEKINEHSDLDALQASLSKDLR